MSTITTIAAIQSQLAARNSITTASLLEFALIICKAGRHAIRCRYGKPGAGDYGAVPSRSVGFATISDAMSLVEC
jgi:hypothetical protein